MINPVVGSFMVPCFMASSAITDRVISAMAETLGRDAASITPATTFESLIAGDSTKIVELVQAMEIAFDEELDGEPIADSAYRNWTTVQNAIDFLAGLGQ